MLGQNATPPDDILVKVLMVCFAAIGTLAGVIGAYTKKLIGKHESLQDENKRLREENAAYRAVYGELDDEPSNREARSDQR